MVAHPGIVGYYGSFVEDGTLNVVMEHAANGTLFQTIQRAKTAFMEAEIIAWAAQLLLALQHLHSKKILHRDLKTKNIFMTKQVRAPLPIRALRGGASFCRGMCVVVSHRSRPPTHTDEDQAGRLWSLARHELADPLCPVGGGHALLPLPRAV